MTGWGCSYSDLELDEHVPVLGELARPSQVSAPQVMKVAAVGGGAPQAGVHLTQEQHGSQLYQVGPVKPWLLRSLQIDLHPTPTHAFADTTVILFDLAELVCCVWPVSDFVE